ncbi:MAG: hydrogenase formation protein HypD [Planctomycetota bacterium]
MRYVDEFRDPQAARQLIEQIRGLATRRWVLMEVCGGQTHSLLRYGIDEALEDCVELIHGPGCPVCVTDTAVLDLAVEAALEPGWVLAGFGDMLRVPGTRLSLQQAQAFGGRVLAVYSPWDAVEYAQRNPQLQVVFLAVGFETTAPATALAVLEAHRLGLTNFSVLSAHVRVLPAMEWLMKASIRVQAFLAAGHVCTVTGYGDYHTFVQQYRLPVAIAGFEPLDLLLAIHACVRQLEAGTSAVENCYLRAVIEGGNPAAQRLVQEVYVPCDRSWRGFGRIPDGGLRLRPQFSAYDAERRLAGGAFSQSIRAGTTAASGGLPVIDAAHEAAAACCAGEVLAGLLKPPDCPHFGRGCHPDKPLGAPMVSSEGACAAWFRYHPPQHETAISSESPARQNDESKI